MSSDLQQALAKHKNKQMTIGTVTFGVPIESKDIKPGLTTSEILKELKKASKENLFKPKADVCY